MNKLFTNISGQGEPLLVLHGWGMNHSIWTPIKSDLEKHFRVTWIDLPGHGESADIALGDLEQLVSSILTIINDSQSTEKLHVMGWSLGGLVAQRLAELEPDRIASLTLIATSPSFVQRQDWQHAMPQDLLQSFYENLSSNFEITIKRFLALQFMGVKGIQSQLKQLRESNFKKPPQLSALQEGLQVLQNTDLRNSKSGCRKFWILGSLDKLVPVDIAKDLTDIDGEQSVAVIDGAGHAPFVSHPEVFLQHVYSFILDQQEYKKNY